MGQVCHGSATTTHGVLAAIQTIASFARDAEPGTGDQPQDGGEVAQAGDGRGPEDGTEGTTLDGPDRGRGSDDRRVPPPYAVAAG